MKLLAALAVAALAQTGPGGADADRKKGNKNKTPSYGNNNNGGGNNNNNNNNNYGGGNGGGNNDGGNGSNYGGGAAYGDPHFMVVSVGQEPLCFDFQPPAGSDMNLLIDPETALSVTATAEARDNNKTFMSKIHFSSPNGAKLEFDEEGVHLSGLLEEASGKHPVTGHVQYGDIVFVEHWTEDGLHENTHIEIDNGPSFIIKGSVTKKSLSFACVDGAGLSEKTRGIIGQFMHTDAYVVKDTEETDEDGNAVGQVSAGGMTIDATNEKFHHSDHCWVVDEQDVLMLMANL